METATDRIELFDVSLRIAPGMLAWPTGRPVATHVIVDGGQEAGPRNSEWHLDSHAGTHVDAPLHWCPSGADAEAIPLAACLGPCSVVGVESERLIEPHHLPEGVVRRGHRLLLKTRNSSLRLGADGFDPGFVALSESAARRLADAAVSLVGIDYLSVESPAGDGVVHRALLNAGVVLLEGLDLRAVEPGDYNLAAFPLRLQGGEASPVRAVLWR